MSRSSTKDALVYRSLAMLSVYRPIVQHIVEISFALRPSIYCSVIPIRFGHHVGVGRKNEKRRRKKNEH